jgi:hypothetical protein
MSFLYHKRVTNVLFYQHEDLVLEAVAAEQVNVSWTTGITRDMWKVLYVVYRNMVSSYSLFKINSRNDHGSFFFQFGTSLDIFNLNNTVIYEYMQ